MRNRKRWHLLVLLGVLAFASLPAHTQAIEIPPPGINAYIQTSGPDTPLYVGDYYNSITGGNPNERNNNMHLFEVFVPCTWDPNQTLTFSLFDPEINPKPVLNPLPNAPTALDEVRYEDDNEGANGQDNQDTSKASITNFALTAPGGAKVAHTYSPEGGTNGLWSELVTFTPGQAGYGCGVYQLTSNAADDRPYRDAAGNIIPGGTQDNDDNAWVLRVVHDSDCTPSPGTCSPLARDTALLMSNGNESDDLDNLPGTGDELIIGLVRTSFQHGAEACQNFYSFVSGRSPTVSFYNFDMDLDISDPRTVNVTYFAPEGSPRTPIKGSASLTSRWNSLTPPPPYANVQGGDVIPMTGADAGWWRIQVCINTRNQYIFQGPEDLPIYFSQPPTPVMQIVKSDQQTLVQPSQVLTYTLGFTNTSNTTPTPGVATSVVLTDTLPANTTYLNCAIARPFTGTCGNQNGRIVLRLSQSVAAGQAGSAWVSVRVNDDFPALPAPATTLLTNTVQMNYQDSLGNPFGPIFANDVNQVRPTVFSSPPTAITLARLTAVRVDGVALVRWMTTSEHNTFGFNVLRSPTRQRATAQRVTEQTVLGQGRGTNGGSYEWRDPTPVTGQQPLYWLQEVETDGTTHEYGPVQLVDEQRLFTPLIMHG